MGGLPGHRGDLYPLTEGRLGLVKGIDGRPDQASSGGHEKPRAKAEG